jgi:hypothetical protein
MAIRLKLMDRKHLLDERLTEHVRERTDKLGRIFDGVRECRVSVDGPEDGHFRVRVYLSVPDAEVAIDRQVGADMPMAIRESFDAAEQRLGDYVRRGRESAEKGSRRSKRKR